MKRNELKPFRERLLAIRARLRGDVDRMRDPMFSCTSRLTRMPIHAAETAGSHYDAEMNVHLMVTKEEVPGRHRGGPGEHRGRHLRHVRGVRAADCQSPLERDPVRRRVRHMRLGLNRGGRSPCRSDRRPRRWMTAGGVESQGQRPFRRGLKQRAAVAPIFAFVCRLQGGEVDGCHVGSGRGRTTRRKKSRSSWRRSRGWRDAAILR